MRTRLKLPAAAVGILLLVATLAAVTGPVRFTDPIIDFSFLQQELPEETDEPAEDEFEEPELDDEDVPGPVSVIAGVVTSLILIGIFLAVVVGVLRLARAALELRPSPPSPERDDVVIDELRAAAKEQAEQLATVEPGRARDGVVACWVRLEEIASAAGRPRDPAHTPIEFTAALLTSFAADDVAVAELRELYHRARFSNEPVTAASAAEASAALRRISTTLGAGAPEAAEGSP